MTKYENDCSILIFAEMQEGIMNHGLFRTAHDGFGIIMEEVEEAQLEMKDVESCFIDFKKAVFTDDMDAAIEYAEQLAKSAKRLMIEAMQSAAMAQKFIATFKKGGEPDAGEDEADTV